MLVVSLNAARSGIPDLNRAVFRACHHPFAFTVERHTRHVVCMAFECEDGSRVGGFDIVEFHRMVTCCGEIPFIRGYTETIHLAVWVGYCSRADATEGFPESEQVVSFRLLGRDECIPVPDGVVIAGYSTCQPVH